LFVFLVAFGTTTAVFATVTAWRTVDADAHDDGEAEIEPYRVVEPELSGDRWVLDHADAAIDRWQNITVEAVATGMGAANAVVAREQGSLLETRTLTTLRRPDLSVEVFPAAGMARIIDRSQVVADLPSMRSRTLAEIEQGSYASRLPEEQATGWDSLDLALAPSYWIRTMVDRMATEVVVVGEETVAGRTAHVVKLAFGGGAARNYGRDGWTWWVDQETGILLKYAIGAESQDEEPFVFEMTRITLEGSVPTSIEVPAGLDITAVEITPEGPSEMRLEPSLVGVDARSVVEHLTP